MITKLAPVLLRPSRRSEQAQAQTVLLLILACLLGAGLTALFLYSKPAQRSPGFRSSTSSAPGGLSEESRGVLAKLEAPVEVRFYTLLDPASVPNMLQLYANRVESVLKEYEQNSGGKLTVQRFANPESDDDALAAAGDGIRAFNRDKGRACFFGLVVAQNTQRETLPQLSSTWEPALEADITRAIERLSAQPVVRKVELPPLDPAAEQAVRKALPDLDNLSLAEGNRRLRQIAIEEFAQAISELTPGLKAAEKRLSEAKSPAEQEAARKELQTLQAQQAQKIKDLAAKSQSQVQALQQIKSAPK